MGIDNAQQQPHRSEERGDVERRKDGEQKASRPTLVASGNIDQGKPLTNDNSANERFETERNVAK